MVFLATVATVIASQAVISGAFSVAHQAGRLGYLPRLRIQYTSEEMMGQIYVPWVNWLLLVAVVALVLAFRTSAALAYAYGTAVTGTITITTLLFFYYARHQWRWPLFIVLAGGGVLITIDLVFFAVNLTKLTHGGRSQLVPWPGRPLRPVGVGGFGEAERRKLADGERGQVLIQLRAGDGAGQYDRCPRLGQRRSQRDRIFGDTARRGQRGRRRAAARRPASAARWRPPP